MAEFLDGFAALQPYLQNKGEDLLRERGGISIGAGLTGRISMLDIWEPKSGLLLFTLPLPFLFSSDRWEAAVAAVARINSQLIVPGFFLRDCSAKWAILFGTCAYLNHDGTISSQVVDTVIEVCRTTADRYVSELHQIVKDD
jgi:hypothetical protein